ncbi:peptide ABC transporter substrate-binding protein [Phytoactinopolyspora limicola]|uniref:peptide ABC transporter substrate-binding protein n=1 Tax=Phytoactinopolyspora limicola TaxID=2715536 RepID=UPI001409AB7A|nr:peptide ABC transporter substrate-binding protein [Phytoactinopolyspora limicola]
MNTFQPVTRRSFLATVLAAAASTAAACSFDSESPDGRAEPGATNSPGAGTRVLRQMMIPVADLDPTVASGASFGQILMAGLMEGLVVLDADGTGVQAGAASAWDVSADGRTYTFTIRPEATWSNGDQVTAADFEWNWHRLLSPTASDRPEGTSSYNQAAGVVGAADFLSGQTTDFADVGVSARDDSTFEITLEAPNPDFLYMLAAYWALPLHPATVEEHSTGWSTPENWVGNGPFVLDAWRTNASATLVPNEHYWDRDNYHLDRWEVRFNDAGATADILAYQSGEIDVVNVSGALEAVTSDPELEPDLVTAPQNVVNTLNLLSSHNPVLYDVRVRKALSLAIDRDQIAALQYPRTPGVSLVPDGVPGHEQVPATTYDLDQAKALLAEAGFADGAGVPTVTILINQPTAWIEAVAEMWRTGLGIEVTLDLVELGVYVEKRGQLHPDSYTGFWHGSFGVNPPTLFSSITGPLTSWRFLAGFAMPAEAAERYQEVSQDTSMPPDEKVAELEGIIDADAFPEIREFKDLAEQAVAERDPDIQRRLLLDAAVARESAYVSLPVIWGSYALLIKPHVQELRPWTDSTVFTTRGVQVAP